MFLTERGENLLSVLFHRKSIYITVFKHSHIGVSPKEAFSHHTSISKPGSPLDLKLVGLQYFPFMIL